ncbi:MAG: inositol monophosphatase family protein [Treponemataceae bacterium]
MIDAMVRAAREAAAFQLLEFRSRDPGWGNAKAAREFVSFVDVESEKIIRRTLEKALPSAAFYGEETERTVGKDATWIVDPIDGTVNYLSGYDHWCVSIALMDGMREEGSEIAAGLILKPATGELFTAERGRGAFRNGTRLPRATKIEATDALIVMGTPFRSPDTIDAYFRVVRKVLASYRELRRTGSAALDVAYLAAGYFQGYWEVDLKPYDIAAGLLMLSETGHDYRNFAGEYYDLFKDRGFVSARPGILESLMDTVRTEYAPIR